MRIRLLALLVAAGCGTDSAPSVELLPGFAPPDPGPDGIQLVAPPVRGIQPGTDVTYCTYLDYNSDRDVDIYAYEGYQTMVAGHHVILYAASQAQPAGTHECTEQDMLNVRYLGGGGADSPGATLPDGIVIRMPANTQVMIQHHWINATDQVVDGQAAFNIQVEAPDPSHINSQMFTTVSTQFELPPGAGSAHADCVVQADMSFFVLGGHAHDLGTRVSISVTPAAGATAGTPTMIYDTPWSKEYQANPPRNMYTKDQPLEIHVGDRVSVDCEYNNTTGAPVSFPREMCVEFGYFFPATQEIDCVDGAWPGG
jgi:hypothetical protein